MRHHNKAIAALIQENADYIGRWLEFASPDYSEADGLDFLERGLANLSEQNGMNLGIFHNDSLIGTISYNYFDLTGQKTEIGYWLAKEWQGRGIMTTATRALTSYAIKTLGFNRVDIHMDVLNERSEAIPRRLGYQMEGVRRQWMQRYGQPYDTRVFYILADQWQDGSFAAGQEILYSDLGNNLSMALLLPHHAEQFSDVVRNSFDYLAPWIPWVKPDYTPEDARAIIQRYLQKLADNNGMAFALFAEGQFAGMAAYQYWNWRGARAELGYWIGEPFQGLGLVTRAVENMTTFATRWLGINRIDILTDIHNRRSSLVAERLGYDHEGIRRHYYTRNGLPVDLNVYVMLAENWQNGR